MRNNILVLFFLWTATLQLLHAQSRDAVAFNRFFKAADVFFLAYVDSSGQVAYSQLKGQPAQLDQLIEQIASAPIEGANADSRKAFLINAYNILVIKSVIEQYPMKSPLDQADFFQRKVHQVAGQRMSLEQLEKKELMGNFPDARLHFVLNCGAKSCPALTPFAYWPNKLEEQLDAQTRKVLDDPAFLPVDDFAESIGLSQLFQWYEKDFKPSVRDFIDQYRSDSVPPSYRAEYYNYNWQLNDQAIKIEADDLETKLKFTPIIGSAALPKGAMEFKSFNGAYTAKYYNDAFGNRLRSTFFSSFNSFSYGLNGRLDLGFDLVVRSTLLGDFSNKSLFRVLTLPNGICVHEDVEDLGLLDSIEIYKVAGVSHFAPTVRWVPFKKRPTFSIRQAIYAPIQRSVDGSWIWVTQFSYAHNFNPKHQLYLDFTIWQTIYPDQPFRLSMPFFKAFYTWLPTNRLSFYGTTTWLFEWGAGAKFLILPGWEIEFLATRYLPIPIVESYFGKGASTLNMGMRFRF
jgi:hypothetical protein